ncbi:MAG TPA: hypothetical protein VGH74_11445 [Planctomycetaceae bacterium]|jgi:hypothetical protein
MTDESLAESKPGRRLALVLRGLGCFEFLALLVVVAPEAWIDVAHRWAGLGALPREPIVGYLARSASALYALHGAIVVFLSFDVNHYERLIRFMAWAAVVHGAVILGIDIAQELPVLWRYAEGPGFTATGLLVLALQRSQFLTRPTAQPKPAMKSIAHE